jgi:hypothetical protein
MASTGFRRILCFCVTLAATAVLLHGAGPTFWVVGTTAELLKGTSDGVLIDRSGTLSAGPRLTNVLTSTPAQIWCLAVGADNTLWAGTGGDGRVIRVRPGQREETVFDAGENNVFALAVAGSRVYAATGPNGQVYVIDGNNPARPFFNPEEKYIWALAVDGTGRLWVGAGNPAVIYRVDANGTSHVVYKPPAAHVVSLLRDSSGRMLAGTESPGRLYRFDANDRPFVLLDSGLTEVRAMALGANDTVYAAALSRSDEGGSGTAEASSSVAAAMAASPSTQTGAASAASASSSATHRSVIFKIDSSGSWESFWESPDLIYDIAMESDGNLLAATGPDGRLYTIQADREVFLHTGVDAKQIIRLVSEPGKQMSAMATANPGRLITLGPAAQSPATYISPVRDTKSASSWGTIRWEAAGGVALFTRSGNTEKPDDSWSDWAGPYTRKDGETIKSPPARFLQWKAVLTTGTSAPAPRLTSVTTAYLTRNTRPVVTSVTVHPPGVVFQRPFSSEDGAIAGLDDAVADSRKPPGVDPNAPATPPLGRRMFQKGLQTIAWKAEDADGDRLTYSLLYRREGDTTWHDLRADLTDSIFVWDTTSVGDGRYTIKVVASDDSTNTPDRALKGERESDPIDVDNTPPVITTEVVRRPGGLRLAVHVHDALSAILKVEYSVGSGPWQLIYPIDGLADSPDEQYEIPVANEAEAARVIIRASDILQNVASKAAGR